MNKYIEQFSKFMTADDWSFLYECSPHSQYLRSIWKGNNSIFDLVLDAREETDIIMCFVYLRIKVPVNQRINIAELFCRINWHLNCGRFDLDLNDGEMRFCQSIDIEGSELNFTMFNNMRNTALSTCDNYFPAIMSVIFGEKSALDALNELEKNETGYYSETVCPISLQ